METVIINPIRKGRFTKMKKRKKGHFRRNPAKKSKHGTPTITGVMKKLGIKVSGKKGHAGKKAKAKTSTHKARSHKKGHTQKKAKSVRRARPSHMKTKKGIIIHRPRLHEVSSHLWKRGERSMIPAGVMINPLLRGYHKKGRKGKKSYRKGGLSIMKNPISSIKNVIKDVPEAVYAGAGLLGVTAVMNLIPSDATNPMSAIRTNALYRIAGKTAITVGLGMLVKAVLKKPAISKMVVLGGTLNILNDLAGITKLSAFLPVETGTAMLVSGGSKITNDRQFGSLISEKEVAGLFN